MHHKYFIRYRVVPNVVIKLSAGGCTCMVQVITMLKNVTARFQRRRRRRRRHPSCMHLT